MNWTSRFDRRNVSLCSYATVDTASRFTLGMHLNFDGRVDPFEVNQRAAMAGDEVSAGRNEGSRLSKHDRVALLDQISLIYARAESRDDVENAEIDHHSPDVRQMPPKRPACSATCRTRPTPTGCCCAACSAARAPFGSGRTWTRAPCPGQASSASSPMRSGAATPTASTSASPSARPLTSAGASCEPPAPRGRASGKGCRQMSRTIGRRCPGP